MLPHQEHLIRDLPITFDKGFFNMIVGNFQ